jgi:hypothetical protein
MLARGLRNGVRFVPLRVLPACHAGWRNGLGLDRFGLGKNGGLLRGIATAADNRGTPLLNDLLQKSFVAH